jgi:hypothetical protein
MKNMRIIKQAVWKVVSLSKYNPCKKNEFKYNNLEYFIPPKVLPLIIIVKKKAAMFQAAFY